MLRVGDDWGVSSAKTRAGHEEAHEDQGSGKGSLHVEAAGIERDVATDAQGSEATSGSSAITVR